MIQILTGNNSYLLKSERSDIVNKFTTKHGEHSVELIDGTKQKLDDLMASVQSMPFLASAKLVVVDDIADNADMVGNIENILDQVIDEVHLLIYLPSVDKRSSLYKTLKKQPGFTELGKLTESQLQEWLIDLAKQKGYQLNSSDARYMIEFVGDNQLKLAKELDKIGCYNKHITRETIEKLAVKSISSNTFDMLDAAFSGNSARAIEYYKEQRLLGVEPQPILGAIVWQLRVLLAIKYSNLDINQIAKLSKFSPYSLRKSEALAKKLSKNDLKKLVGEILLLDVASKSKPINIDEAINMKLIEIGKLA